jgi:hypothetical protein
VRTDSNADWTLNALSADVSMYVMPFSAGRKRNGSQIASKLVSDDVMGS